jgi:SNF2 family DNA or RNA helicase
MISILKEEEKLIIDYSVQPELNNLQYTFPLRGMGFGHEPSEKRYILEEVNDWKIVSVLRFFRSRGFQIERDPTIVYIENAYGREVKLLDQGKQLGGLVKAGQFAYPLVIPNFQRKLTDYQDQGVKFMMAVHHAANFGTPGCGKTTMCLSCYSLHNSVKNVNKLLVIGPVSCFSAWEEESYECFGRVMKSFRLIGSERFNAYDASKDIELFLTTYQTAANDVNNLKKLLKQDDFMVILDESHYIKSSKDDAVWANAMLQLAPYAKVRIICSGTPMPNGLEDLWSQMTFLWPNGTLLGKKRRYLSRLKNTQEQERITKELQSLFYRVTKSTLGLPPVTMIPIEVEMAPFQKKLYNMVGRSILEEAKKYSTREISEILRWSKARIVRLLQISSNPSLLSNGMNTDGDDFDGNGDLIKMVDNYTSFEQSSKVKKAIELATELVGKGEKVLIWSWFVRNIKELAVEFAKLGIPVYQVYGEVPKDANANEEFNREKEIKGFRFSKEPCILLANPAACSESISLHREAHHAIYLDRTFNCCQFLQSLDRIHRVGLPANQETFYYIIQNKHSIDGVVEDRLMQKASLMFQVLESDLPVGTSELLAADWSTPEDMYDDFHEVLCHLQNELCLEESG